MPNAIAYSQFQISGGLKALFWSCLAVAIGAPTLVFVNAQSDPPNAVATLSMWLRILLIIQSVLLFGIIPSRVHGAMKRDRQQKLIESHRLMPTPAWWAVTGYIVGPNLVLLAVSGIVMLVGMFVSIGAGLPVSSWVAQHVVLGFSCVMLSCLCAFFGQATPAVNPALVGPFLFPLGLGGMVLLPAWQLIMTPLQGSGVWALTTQKIDLPTALGVGMQLLIGLVLFVGAARRYRRDDQPALGVWWGLALVLVWVSGTLAASMVARDMRAGSPLFRLNNETITFVASLSVSMLLAVGPIASAAFMRIDWTNRSAVDAHLVERRPIGIALTSVLTLLLLLTLLLVAPREWLTHDYVEREAGWVVETTVHHPGAPHVLLTIAVVALFAATIATFTTAIVHMRLSPAKWNAVWIALFWGIGPLLDVAGRAMMNRRFGEPETYPTFLTWLSPPGTLAAIWTDRHSDAAIGLTVQTALFFLALSILIIKRQQRAPRG
jgi:hypothetical protein